MSLGLLVPLAVAPAMAVAWAVTGALVRMAPRWGLVDTPGQHRAHARTTPLGGGLGIYAGVVATALLAVATAAAAVHVPAAAALLPEALVRHAPGVLSKAGLLAVVLGAASVQMLLGLIDDWRDGGLDFRLRLLVELVLVGVLVACGVRLTLFTEARWVGAAVTVVWIVGLTNALNFLDNMDGLSAGVTLWASVLLAGVALLVGDLFVAGCFLTLVGSIAGFLRHNWHPARIFMGDAGSNFLGFFVGALTVLATFSKPGLAHVTVLAPLCILAVPIYDSTLVVLIRLFQGRSPFHADRQHVSHRLVALGFRPVSAVVVLHLLTVATGLGGVLLYFVPAQVSGLVVAQIGCMLGVLAVIEIGAFRVQRQRHGQDR